MKTAELVTCLVLFTSWQVKAFESETTDKWIRSINGRSTFGDEEEEDKTKSKRHLVFLAAYNRDWESVISYTQNGFNSNAADPEGRTLAMIAAESGQWDTVHWLRQQGADINLQDSLKRSVLHIASSERQWHDLKMLVTNGSDINAADCLGRTPTIIAASYKEWDIVQWLIEQGADISTRDGFGRSVLLLAASHNNWRLVKWLFSRGADPKVADQNGRTLLHLAAIADNLEVVQILVEDFDADFNQEDKGGNTPINLAAISNDPKGSVYNYLIYMREMKSQTSTYRRGNAEYKIKELSLLDRVKKMYEVMSKGESFLNVKMYGKVILVLGNLKSGKSTLIKYLTTSTDKLTSQPVVEGSGLFKIVPINGTAVPSSVYPLLVNYKEKGAVFCDGPRFSDMGTISQDLTSMHFLKKVTEKFKRVKLVFTVTHLTLKRGMNSGEFITFLQHSTNFITDFAHFSESSCIVVTKFDGPKIDVIDAQLERAAVISISKAVESMTEELVKEDLPPEKRTFFKRSTEFLLIFLQKNRLGQYDKIKVFRRPKTAGPLNKMVKMNWSKERLSKYLFDEMSYVKVKRSHFDYPLSDMTFITLYKSKQAANREITSAMTSIANHIEDQLFSRARNSVDFFKVQQWFREGCKRIEEIMKLVSEVKDPSSMLFHIRLALEHVQIYPRRISTFKIEHFNRFLNLLKTIMKNKFKTTPWEWRDPFRMLLISIRQTKEWYELLAYLYRELLTYKFQANREIYDVRNLENWGHATTAEGLYINQNNVERFLKVLSRDKIRRIEAIELRHFHDFEFKSLNEILKFLIRDKPITDCGGHLFASSYVSLKHYITKCFEKDKVMVFATSKIFIDCNLINYQDVVLIAPTWEVIGKIKFDLGVNSSFRGIGMNFINIDKLTITTKKSGTPQPSKKDKVLFYESGESTVPLPEVINKYQSYALEHLTNKFVSSKIMEFLAGIDHSPKVLQHYQTSTLLKELMSLEDRYNELKNKIDFLPFYESLLERIKTYSKSPKENENDKSYKLAIIHLYTVVMSKVSTLKQDRRDNLVLNIAEFFRLSEYIIEQVREEGNKVAVTEFKDKFENDLQQKLDEGREMIKNKVVPAIPEIFDALKKTLEDLIEVVREKIEDLKKMQKKLEDHLEKLKRHYAIKAALGIFGRLASFLSFLGPVGEVAKVAVDYGIAIGNMLNEHPGEGPQVDTNLAAGVNFLNNYDPDDGEDNFERSYIDIFNTIKSIGAEVYEKVIDLETIGLPLLRDLVKSRAYDEIKSFISEQVNKIRQRLDNVYKKFENSEFGKTAKKVLNVIKMISPAVNIWCSWVTYIKDMGKEEIAGVEKKIERVKHNIKQLQEYEDNVRNKMIPMVDDMKKNVNKMQESLNNQTFLQLDITKFKIHNILRDTQRQFSMMTEGFGGIQARMNFHMDNVRAAMDIQICVLQKIQDYTEQAEMANYMHQLNNPDSLKIQYPQEIERDINKLDLMISSNLLLNHHARALGALKQWVFPFAHDYLGAFQIPDQLNYKSNITDLVKRAKEELENIQMAILTDATVPTKRDRCTLNTDFYFEKPKGPFHIWKNSENVDFIISLLSGEEVTANVDIRQNLDFNAMKFRYIKLNFRAIDERKQHDLNKLLQYFEIRMTHLGNSHFHCDGKIYTMTSESLEIRYSLHEDPPGKHSTVNEIFNKLRKGDMMLSPYATWKFQLLDSAKKGSFGKLLAFVDDVDVTFEGEGQYLNEDCVSQCNNNVDVYYKVDGTA